MRSLTRRDFTRRLLVAGILPVTAGSLHDVLDQQQSGMPNSAPDTVAGHTLSSEEKTLAAKFLSQHEKSMMPLRAVDLPNSLMPSFSYRIEPPASKRKSGNG